MKKYNTKDQIFRLLITLVSLVLLGSVCSYLFKDHIEYYGEIFISQMGIYGLMFGTILTDTSPLPLTSEPIALLGLGAKIPLLNIIISMSIASHISGGLGYFFGKIVTKYPENKKFLMLRFPIVFE